VRAGDLIVDYELVALRELGGVGTGTGTRPGSVLPLLMLKA